MSIIAQTPQQISLYQALVVRQGLKACKIGMRVNRAYTPANLMRAVTRITGKKHKARDYDGALASLQEWLEQKRDESHVEYHFGTQFPGCGVEHLPEEDVMLTLPDNGGAVKYRRVYSDEPGHSWRYYETTHGDSLEIVSGPEQEEGK